MKGFYFSMDALTASMILLATTTLIMSYSPPSDGHKEPDQLDMLHASSMQKVSDWNSSINSRKSVISYIYLSYYEESPSKAQSICENYFNLSKDYAIYISNSTFRQKLCGDYTVSNDDNLASTETILPDIPVNSNFRGPYTAIMVMKN